MSPPQSRLSLLLHPSLSRYTWDGVRTCWMSNSTSYRKYDTRSPPITSGWCEGGGCTAPTCAQCVPPPPPPPPPPPGQNLVVHVANDGWGSTGSLSVTPSTFVRVHVLRFRDGMMTGEMPFTPRTSLYRSIGDYYQRSLCVV